MVLLVCLIFVRTSANSPRYADLVANAAAGDATDAGGWWCRYAIKFCVRKDVRAAEMEKAEKESKEANG